MIAIRLRFTAGRFHATPWDHHVNEGLPEWPPSPWRLLRALAAASLRLPAEARPATRRIILTLADYLPVYWLPPVATAHTRHYMPVPQAAKPEQTTKVFDTFVAVGGGAGAPDAHIVVGWPDVELSPADREVLATLLRHVAYLGRSESWVDAELVGAPDEAPNATPVGASVPDTGDELNLWSCVTEDAFQSFRDGFLAAGGRSADVPADRWEALTVDTGELQAARWSRAPGSRTVRYRITRRPAGSRPRVSSSRRDVQVVLYMVQGKVLPTVWTTLSVAERVRNALLARSRDESGESHPVFLGRVEGRPCEGHRHAFILPLAVNDPTFIDHIAVYARDGFDDRALTALRGLHRVWASGDRAGLRLTAIAQGTVAELTRPGEHGADVLNAFRASRTWESRTPFVCYRHPRRRGGVWVDTPIEQVVRACRHIGLPEPEVSPLPHPPQHWLRFYRTRQGGGGSRGGSQGFGFRLVFPYPVTGPVALGYANHFGLGQFTAV